MTSFHFLRTAARMGFEALREGRLSMSPRRWLIDLRHLRGQMDVPPFGERPSVTPTPRFGERKSLFIKSRADLETFLASGDRLVLPTSDRPRLSVLIVLFNRAELTLRCLRSIAAHVPPPFEVVLVDNASTDDTHDLLSRVDGAHVGYFPTNAGFLRGANTAALAARGDLLLFLNNDVELLPGSVASAIATIEGLPEAGAVGGRLVFPDGTLQEAGSIIWRDGSCQGYGRGDQPDKAEYRFVRDVDFASAAFLLTPRDVFERLDGFDAAYAPAYYEDADYCVRLWKQGKRVVYDPSATAVHVEFGSSSPKEAQVHQQKNRDIFVTRHREWLAGQWPPGPGNIVAARSRQRSGLRILVIDDRMPRADLGFGFPRALDLLESLVAEGHTVTLYATDTARAGAESLSQTSPIEVLGGYGWPHIEKLLAERRGCYDVIIVSRPHNMERMRMKFGAPTDWAPPARVIYDAEAIAAAREAGRLRLAGQRVEDSDVERMIDREIELARGTAAVIAVSENERRAFVSRMAAPVYVAPFSQTPRPTAAPFEERRGFLFVGSFDELSPNTDAVRWFTHEVLPLVRSRLGSDVRFVVVGRHAPASIRALQSNGVDLCTNVVDLTPFYNRARVFVAPTRFAAGLPYKVAHAAAHGVPVVCTRLLQEQLGWQSDVELLAADDAAGLAAACVELHENPHRWALIRAAALARVTSDCSPQQFRAAIRAALS